MNRDEPQRAIALPQPDASANVQEWVDWFYASFLPGWIERARDPAGFGFYDLLDINAMPLQQNRRTILAQARLLFTFSHLALATGSTEFHDAARVAYEALHAFQKAPGSYSRARAGNQQHTSNPEDNRAYSYDQTFVILGMVTWGQLNSCHNVNVDIEACWSSIENTLTDKATGLLLEHDELSNPLRPTAPPRAQNPHMHLYEAALQAYEMTGSTQWLERAQKMRCIGLKYFFDKNTGTIIEFIAPDLSTLAGRDGQRREIGHQSEWAWLLYREAELGGDNTMGKIADKLLMFADDHGFVSSGPMQTAAFDAVSADTSWYEDTFLLWPQTEAIKSYAIRQAQADNADRARYLMLLVFEKYFAGHKAYVNQLDNSANPIWTQALSRLLYHVVLAVTEGARAGLWKTPVSELKGRPCSAF